MPNSGILDYNASTFQRPLSEFKANIWTWILKWNILITLKTCFDLNWTFFNLEFFWSHRIPQTLSELIIAFQSISKPIRAFLRAFLIPRKPFWTVRNFKNCTEPSKTYQNLSEPSETNRISKNLSEPFRTFRLFLNLSEPFRAFQSLSVPFRAFQSLSEP